MDEYGRIWTNDDEYGRMMTNMDVYGRIWANDDVCGRGVWYYISMFVYMSIHVWTNMDECGTNVFARRCTQVLPDGVAPGGEG